MPVSVATTIPYKSGAPWAKARDSSTCFEGWNPRKHTPLRSYQTSRGNFLTLIHGHKVRGFLNRRVNDVSEKNICDHKRLGFSTGSERLPKMSEFSCFLAQNSL